MIITNELFLSNEESLLSILLDFIPDVMNGLAFQHFPESILMCENYEAATKNVRTNQKHK